ncbi:MAG: Omp28-related outer membrane protein [Lentimicrobiaceae bacterium]|nr:Omp28-related outer membrane protein [Lentimicrobiaceae bacterium]
MKIRLFFLIFLVVFYFLSFAQGASTTLQKKSILLEEFTGIYCGYCPQGHELAHYLMNANEHAYVVAIHAGFLAEPDYGDPDYRIAGGEILDASYNDYGYPSGLINRKLFDGTYIMNRGGWIKSAKATHAEDAPVNILLTTVFDGNTHKLSVKAEGYYTMEVTEASHRLNIVVIENNIIGHQSGIGGGSNYLHNRMLRSFITQMNEAVWGEEIVAPTQGSYFEFNYDYDLPEHINDIPIKPENIEIIAFVCAGKTDVLNVTGAKPSYINFVKPFEATLLEAERKMGARYGFNFFDAQLQNLSHKTITSATFELNLNGEIQKIEWNGEIPAFQTRPVLLTIEPYIINTSNQYAIQLIALNNEPYNGNTISGSFNEPVATTPKIFIEIKTDLYADENQFVIKDRDGNIVATFGPYKSNEVAVYNETITLDKDVTYCLEVMDQWWDGMLEPRGYIKLHSEDGELITQNYQISLFGEKVFIHTSKESSSIVSHTMQQSHIFYDTWEQQIKISFFPLATGKIELLLYSVTGVLLLKKTVYAEEGTKCNLSLPASHYDNGIYFIRIETEKSTITKKIIKY